MNPTKEDVEAEIDLLIRNAESLKWLLGKSIVQLRPAAVGLVRDAGEVASVVGAYQATAKKEGAE